MNIRSADGPLATLPEILDRRELRARQQMALLQQGPCVVSFSMNIPGARKAFPLAAAGFEEGLAQIRTILPPNCEITCLRNGGTAGEEGAGVSALQETFGDAPLHRVVRPVRHIARVRERERTARGGIESLIGGIPHQDCGGLRAG